MRNSNNMKKRNLRIGIVTPPVEKAGIFPLSNLVEIICAFSLPTYLITGNMGLEIPILIRKNVYLVEVPYQYRSSIYLRAVNYIFMQLRIAYKILLLKNQLNIWIFYLDSHLFIFPVIIAKLTGKKVVFSLASSNKQEIKAKRSPFLDKIPGYCESTCLRLADTIILYSENLIKEWSLEKYRKKIRISHKHFLDLNKFKIMKPLVDREKKIAYIGRFSQVKGTDNFVKAISLILTEDINVSFLIGGDGDEKGQIIRYLDEKGLSNKIEIPGWISHDRLPDFLNDVKLLVLPSYTEGLPNIMLEAMACGTPVLATPVGSIPDFIKDGQTGFIMENNSPECIAKNVIRAFNHPCLSQIGTNGRLLAEQDFTFEKAVESYQEILVTSENR
jgi:glycosyltransferase involved in cell wall biosynthesis